MEVVYLRKSDDFIKLGQALKVAGLVESGAEAKQAIQDGEVMVNGETDIRRGRKLYDNDTVEYGNSKIIIKKN